MNYLVTLLISFLFFSAGAQETIKVSLAKRLTTCAHQIDFIAEHGILIRLKTNDMALSAMRKAGNELAAQKLEAKQEQLNQQILAAFKEQFAFAHVYYFYSRDLASIKAGDFSKVYTLDNQPAKYNSRNFFMVDPYSASVSSMNSRSTGFTLLDSSSKVITSPMPKPIIKRFGFIYKTFPQLVFDWNYQFMEMANLSREIKLGRLKAVGNGETFLSKEQERDIAKNQRIIQKIYKKSYPWVNRPKFRNSE